MLALLACQYILGMLTNFFVPFPEGPADQQWQFASTQLLPMAHIVLGLALLVGALVLLVKAIRLKDRVWKIASSVGLGAILLAVEAGSEFVTTQEEGYSFAMSILFIVAVAAYGWGVYKSKG